MQEGKNDSWIVAKETSVSRIKWTAQGHKADPEKSWKEKHGIQIPPFSYSF